MKLYIKDKWYIEFSDAYNEFDFMCVNVRWWKIVIWLIFEAIEAVHYHVDVCTQKFPFQMCLERWNQYFKSHWVCVHVSTYCRPIPFSHPIKRKRRHNKLDACVLKRKRGSEREREIDRMCVVCVKILLLTVLKMRRMKMENNQQSENPTLFWLH